MVWWGFRKNDTVNPVKWRNVTNNIGWWKTSMNDIVNPVKCRKVANIVWWKTSNKDIVNQVKCQMQKSPLTNPAWNISEADTKCPGKKTKHSLLHISSGGCCHEFHRKNTHWIYYSNSPSFLPCSWPWPHEYVALSWTPQTSSSVAKTARRINRLMNCKKKEHTYELWVYPLVCLSVLFNFFLLLKLALVFNIPYIFLFWVCVVVWVGQSSTLNLICIEEHRNWWQLNVIFLLVLFYIYTYLYISAAVHNFSWF